METLDLYYCTVLRADGEFKAVCVVAAKTNGAAIAEVEGLLSAAKQEWVGTKVVPMRAATKEQQDMLAPHLGMVFLTMEEVERAFGKTREMRVEVKSFEKRNGR